MENMSEASALEIALIENLQREDLNPIEEAEAYKELIENFNISQEEVAKKVGKERSTVTNALRPSQAAIGNPGRRGFGIS